MAESVKSLKIQIKELIITAEDELCLHVFTSPFNFIVRFRQESQSSELNVDYYHGGGIHGDGRPSYQHWTKQSFSERDWLQHLMSIFNRTKFQLRLYSRELPVEWIYNILKDFKISFLVKNNVNCPKYTVDLLKRFPTVEAMGTDCSDSQILISNFQKLVIRKNDFNLDSLLSVNSTSLTLDSYLSPKNLNRFLKLWMRGLNSRMRTFWLHIPQEWRRNERETYQEDIVMKGIEYRKIPEKREFKIDGIERPYKDGMDIRRKDGTKATVIIGNEYSSFIFYIWM